jgi:hypothetical protein
VPSSYEQPPTIPSTRTCDPQLISRAVALLELVDAPLDTGEISWLLGAGNELFPVLDLLRSDGYIDTDIGACNSLNARRPATWRVSGRARDVAAGHVHNALLNLGVLRQMLERHDAGSEGRGRERTQYACSRGAHARRPRPRDASVVSDRPLSELRDLVEACALEPSRVDMLPVVQDLDDQDRQRIRRAVDLFESGGDIDFGDGTVLMHDTVQSGGRVLGAGPRTWEPVE